MRLVADIALARGDFSLEVAITCSASTVLMGPNGAGKTTLLRALMGAERPSRGRVVLDGRTLFDHDARVDLPPEARRVAYVPQGFGLFPHLSALDNVLFAARGPTRREHARRLLEELGVDALADRVPAALSGGERQRVALARAMAAEPGLLLLDEPLSALDPRSRPRVRRFLRAWLHDARVPVLVVTHDPADARALASQLVVLEAGRVVQRGTPGDVAVRPATEFVAALTAGLITREPTDEDE